jgi:hypothetical protein
VPVVTKAHGEVIVIEHLGSAHNDTELPLLLHAAQERLHPGQGRAARLRPSRARNRRVDHVLHIALAPPVPGHPRRRSAPACPSGPTRDPGLRPRQARNASSSSDRADWDKAIGAPPSVRAWPYTEDPADGRLLHAAPPPPLKPHHSAGRGRRRRA